MTNSAKSDRRYKEEQERVHKKFASVIRGISVLVAVELVLILSFSIYPSLLKGTQIENLIADTKIIEHLTDFSVIAIFFGGLIYAYFKADTLATKLATSPYLNPLFKRYLTLLGNLFRFSKQD